MLFYKRSTPTVTAPKRKPQTRPGQPAGENLLALQRAASRRQAEQAQKSKLSPFELELMQAWTRDDI